jgi:putative membrane protein
MMFMDDRFILGVGFFITIVMVFLIIGGIVFFIKIVMSGGKKAPKTNEAILEILKTRYAKGEITKEEFEQMKKDIQ